MASGPNTHEETPLLSDEPNAQKHELVYQRFSLSQKKAIVALVSMCGIMPLFISGTFVPCIPQIARDMDTTGTMVSLSVSVSVMATSLGALFGSTYSTFYGRRNIYLVGLPISAIASLGAASASSIGMLMLWRGIQAFGASPGLAVGAGVIGDIYKLEERGWAMGIFFAAVLLGPALAPFVGGAAAHYASWRFMQSGTAVTFVIVFVLMFLFFPETSHPGARGADKLEPGSHPVWRPVILNPFSSMWLLRSPNLLLVAMSAFLVLLTDYVLLIPIAYTIGKRYNITNEALIGACFLPTGLGNAIGAPLSGHISDRIVARWKAKRGKWYPEDRLRACIPGALLLSPFSVLAAGITTEYVDGYLGLSLNLVWLFVNGLGVDFVLSPCSSYVVDVMHSRSAESMAASSAFRSIFMALSIAAILPMIETYGLIFTNTLSACLSWVAFGALWITIKYGEEMRQWVDVGFSNEHNN